MSEFDSNLPTQPQQTLSRLVATLEVAAKTNSEIVDTLKSTLSLGFILVEGLRESREQDSSAAPSS